MCPSANDFLRGEGHENGGRCPVCWTAAQTMYANGQGPYGSLTEAYFAAMKEAEDRALRQGNPDA